MSFVNTIRNKAVEFLIVSIVFGGIVYAATTSYQANMRQVFFEKQLAKIESDQLTIKKSLHKLLQRNKLPTIDLLSKADNIDELVRPIQFDKDSAAISDADRSRLAKVADLLKQTPDVKVTVEGGEISSIKNEYNIELVQKRLDAVKKILMERGITPDRIGIVYADDKERLNYMSILDNSACLTFSSVESEEGQL